MTFNTVVQQYDTGVLADFCDQLPVPVMTTKALRRFLTTLYSNVNNLESQLQSVHKMLWKPDATTGIAIEDVTAWNPELTEKRPGIILKRGAWKRVRAGIDDRLMPDAADGTRYYCNFWQGTHTLLCMAGSGPELEMLLAETFRVLNEFRPLIQQQLQMMRLEVMEVGEQMILEGEARENFVAPINLAYAYQECWQLKSLSAAQLRSLGLGVVQD